MRITETAAVHTHGGLHRRLGAAPGAELTQTTLRVSEADTTKIAEIPENAGKMPGSLPYKEQNPTKTKEVNIIMGVILVIMCVIGAFADLMRK